MIEDIREPSETTEAKPMIRYTQATIDAALTLLCVGGVTIDEVFMSVVEEHRMYRTMLGISEATFTTLDLSMYDEPDTTYPYDEPYEFDGDDDGRYDFEDYERDDGE